MSRIFDNIVSSLLFDVHNFHLLFYFINRIIAKYNLDWVKYNEFKFFSFLFISTRRPEHLEREAPKHMLPGSIGRLSHGAGAAREDTCPRD